MGPPASASGLGHVASDTSRGLGHVASDTSRGSPRPLAPDGSLRTPRVAPASGPLDGLLFIGKFFKYVNVSFF